MGKGQRNREKRPQEHPAYEQLRERAGKLEAAVRVLCGVALLLTVVTLLLPSWSLTILSDNLAANAYTAEETAALSPVMPLGTLSLVLTAIGVLTAAVLLWLRKAPLSLIGLGAAVAGGVMLVLFTVTLGEVFAYDELEQRGLAFTELVTRYYAVLLPTVTLIPAAFLSFSARKKSALAELMETAADNTPTLTLDEDESIISAPEPSSEQ